MAAGTLCVLISLLSPRLAAQQSGRADTDSAASDRTYAVREFLNEDLVFDRYLFPPGRFPEVRWKNRERVERLAGVFPLSVEFFDSAYSPVTSAHRPGRYGAVVRGTTADGFRLERYVTLYCCNVDLDDYSPEVPLTVNPLPAFGITADRWALYRREQRRFSFGSLMVFPGHDPDIAVFLAGLAELTPDGRDTPRLRDRHWWTEFKRRRDGSQGLVLKPPRPKPVSSGHGHRPPADLYSRQDIRRIREICSSWADSAGVPLTVTVLHKGRLAFEGAFGRRADRTPMTRDTPTWMASITKSLTGVLVMQFVDAGIVDLDSSIGRYIPELGPRCPLTLRHLMTHTSGLSWAGEWASDWNPSMENQVAQASPMLGPGRDFVYHRAGYALAAKVLERLSGSTVPGLFREYLFGPLEMTRSTADNTYGGLYCTATDLSRFGQMMLDHGRWRGIRLLSEEAWAAMLPRPLRLSGPRQPRSWGIGCSPQGGKGLSDSTFGHAAASGALLKIDPARDLVVVLGRDGIGPDRQQYDRFTERFLRAVTIPWEGRRD